MRAVCESSPRWRVATKDGLQGLGVNGTGTGPSAFRVAIVTGCESNSLCAISASDCSPQVEGWNFAERGRKI